MKILIEESVLRQALGAMELMRRRPDICKELNAALGAAEKVEPVAWLYKDAYGKLKVSQIEEHDEHDFPVFTHAALTKVGADKTGEGS